MKKIFIIAIFMLLSAITVFGQTCEWAEKIGGGIGSTLSLTVDIKGNIYILGYFSSDTLFFNNGLFLTNSGKLNGFIAKYNNNRICQWAEKIAGSEGVSLRSLVLDANCNIFILGSSLSDTIFFNNSKFIIKEGNSSNFIAKYNNTGKCLWFEQISGKEEKTIGGNNIGGIALDSNNNIYIAGYFITDTVRFNNGIQLANSGNIDGFLAKYDNNGTCQWAEKISGTKSDGAYSISVDEISNIYISGGFSSDTLFFNSGVVLYNSLKPNYYNKSNIFISKYNNNGICLWAERISGDSKSQFYTENMDISRNGDIFIACAYKSDTLNFNNGINLSKSSSKDVFISKYNSNGYCQWVEVIKGASYEYLMSIKVDYNDNVYVAGYYLSPTLTFNNGKVLTNKGFYNGYAVKYNSSGICQWAENVGCNGDCVTAIYSVGVDADKNVYLAGYFTSADSTDILHFNNGKTLPMSLDNNGFIAKYSQSNTSISDKPIQNNIAVYPNPANDYIEINPDAINPTLKRGVDESSDIQIFNTLGEIVLSVEQTPPSVHRIEISNLSPGMYFIKVGNRVEKFVKL